LGLSEASEFIKALATKNETVDVSIVEYLSEQRDALQNPLERTVRKRFGFFSSIVNVLARMFSLVLADAGQGAAAGLREAVRDGTKLAVKWILRASAGMIVWFITYVTGAYEWIKVAWQVVKGLL
jgi:DNA-binding transcriptional regulator LsrR (DeoR family)